MRVETCCKALLKQILPEIDPKREGFCLDIGVGTFAFYCELFARLGFPSVAVEPLPTAKLLKLCQYHKITLLESCLSDKSGTQNLHLGQFANVPNQNFSSLATDWFGSSLEIRQVKTINLSELLQAITAQKVTCLKLDVEGWESFVVQQFADLPQHLLPKLVMFEYGGGASRQKGEKGWSPKFLEATMTCLKTLQKCGYGFSIMVDYASNTKAKVFDLRSLALDPNTLFYPNAVYGNIISFYDCGYPEASVNEICQPYVGGLVNWLVGILVST